MKRTMYILLLLFIILGCSNTNLQSAAIAQNSNDSSRLKGGPYTPAGYSLIWEDNFDGSTINTNNWVVASLKDPVSGDMVPGAVGNHLLNSAYCGYITNEDTYIQNGSLILRNQKRIYQGTSPAGTFNYTSGWVMSMHRVYLNKGYIEVRAKFPSGDKVWPAIWLVSEDLIWGPEWDLWEYFGYRSDQGYDDMGMHLMTGEDPNTSWSSYFLKPFDANYDCETWHVYGFEWTKTYAKWYIDGKVVRTLNASSVSNWPDENMYIILNNGQKTDSPDTTTTWPNNLEIDYIQVYKNTTSTINNGNSKTGLAKPN